VPQHHGHNVEEEASNIKRRLEWKRKPQVEINKTELSRAGMVFYIFDEER
jgi:hypothetical protein